MIIKVERGDSAEGLLIYQRRLDRTPEEQAGATLFALQGIRNIESAAAVLDRAAARSGRKNSIVHIILRAERALSDEEWRIAIMAALEEAGLAGNAFVAVRHEHDDDNPGDHMHVAIVAADRDGNPPPRFYRSTSLDRRVSAEEKEHLPRGDVQSRAWDSQLRRRLMATARRLEDDLGLRPLARNRAVLNEPVRERAKVSQGAREREKRTGIPSLADLLDVPATQAALNQPNYDERATALAKLGLKLQPFFRKNGDLAGLRLHRISDPHLHCPASTLGGNFSLKALDRRSPVLFAEWYQGDTSPTSMVTEQARDKADPLRMRYAEYTRQVAAGRDRLEQERLAVIAWRKRERVKALARRKAAVPAAHTRSARVHRASAMAGYKLACAKIDAEARHQHDAIDSLRVQRLDFVSWLETQAASDPAAARKLAVLRQRGTALPPAAAFAVSTAPPLAASAVPPPLSPGEQAAAVAKQERLMRAADQLAAGKAVLRQREAIEALANRLDEMGVKLIVDADRQDRRVQTTGEEVLIDGVRMMPVPHITEPLKTFTQAKMTEKTQLDQERDLPLAIRSARGLVRHPGETPAAWLARLYGGRHMARWLTPMQDTAIRKDWTALDEAERRRHAPSEPVRKADATINRPATPHTPPLRKAIQHPAASPTPVLPSPTLVVGVTADAPAPLATPRYGDVHQAMAMMKAQRSIPPLGRPTQDTSKSADDGLATAVEAQISSTISPGREAADPGVTPQPNEIGAAALPAQSNAEPAVLPPVSVPVSVPAPPPAPRPAGPQRPSGADLLADWIKAAAAAEADPSRQWESEALAARLVKQDDLAIFGSEMQARVLREADNHQRRLADEARDATKRQAVARDATAAPSPPMPETTKNTQSPTGDTTKPVDPKRTATLSHINDLWQRS